MSPVPLARPDRHALLAHIIRPRGAGDRHRYDTDSDYQWAIHRVWIAVGNKAAAPWPMMVRHHRIGS